MILETLDRFSDRVFAWAGRRRTVIRMSRACSLEVKRRRSVGDHRRLYRSVLRWQEEGKLFCAKRWLFQRILGSRVSDVGVFLLFCGATGIAGNWLLRRADPFSWRILLPVIEVLLSPILLGTSQTCARCIRRSVLLRWLLFAFCGLPQTLFAIKRPARPQRGRFAVAGILAGMLGVWLSPVAIFAGLLGGILLTLLSAVPELAFLLTLLLLPFLNLLPRPTVSLASLLAGGLLLCLGKTVSGKRQGEWGRIDGLVLWLGALFLLSGIASYGSFFEGALRAFLLFAAWFPLRMLFGSVVWRRRGVVALVCASSICAIGGIAEYLLGRAVLSWVDVSRFGDIGGRVCGFFGNPNLFAVFLLLTTPLSLGLLCSQKHARGKILCFAVFATQSLCLLLTWSRGAWLAWIVSVVLFLILCSRRTFSLLLGLCGCGLGLVFYLPDSVLRRFRSIGSMTDTSAHYRINTWRGVLRMARAHPFGIGSGETAFHRIFPYYAVSGTENVMHAHQVFLEVLTELGVVGLLLFVGVLFLVLRETVCFCRNEREGERRAVGVSLIATLTGGLVMGAFDSLWYHHGLYWLFWSVVALLVNVMQEGSNEQPLRE